MQTAVATIRNPETGTEMIASILLDTGSKRTYVSEKVAKSLQLQTKHVRTLGVCTFTSKENKSIQAGVTDFEIGSKNKLYISLTGNVVKTITSSVLMGEIPLSKEDEKSVMNLNMADPYFNKTRNFQVDILIGNDFYPMLLGKQQIRLKKSGVILLETKLGWVTSGIMSGKPVDQNSENSENLALFIDENKPVVLEENSFTPSMEELWNFETIGIKEPKESDENDDLALKQFRDSVKFEYGRVSVKWLKKQDCSNLPTNFPVALNRLKSLLKNLAKNPVYLEKHVKNFSDQLEKGVIEKVSPEMNKGFPTHYIPHHAVITPQKTTTKMRIVFDASAKLNKNSISLNECLLRGPNLLPDLCGLLMRMRLREILLIADIEKAFLQVSLQEPDRDVTRFLWLKDPSKLSVENNLQIYRFCRVPFGFKTSPFLLAGSILFLLESAKGPEKPIADQLCKDLYVDNLISSCKTAEHAIEIYHTAKKLFAAGKMNLREWTSNSKEFLKQIPNDDKVKEDSIKVLGINWNTSEDVLSICIKDLNSFSEAQTKRQILGCIASIFDPLSLLACLKVRGIIFLREIWKLKLDWDDTIPEELQNSWRSLAKSFEIIPQTIFPRCPFTVDENSTVDLICFADASTEAYSAVVYLRHETEDETGQIILIFAKARLTPVSALSIPRAELLAVLIGTRCLKFVAAQLQLNIRHFYLWTDSQIVLGWIRKESRDQGVFVTNRILEITQFENISFAYVPTDQNPADLATKSRSPSYETPWDLWWQGPLWLKLPIEEWPKFETEPVNRPVPSAESILLGGGSQSKTCEKLKTDLAAAIQIENFSSFMSLVRATAHCLRFVKYLKEKTSQRKAAGKVTVHSMRTRSKGNIEIASVKDVTPLTRKELKQAQNLWVSEAQRKALPDLFTEKFSQSNFAQNLGLQLGDDDILRCQGRLGEADLPAETKIPILLPTDSEFTRLVIQTFHESSLHAGVNYTLAKVRTLFWIPGGRQVVSKVLKSCSLCKKHSAKPFAHPSMPNLPKERVTASPPFSFTGVDYFGPLYCRDLTDPKKQRKAWVALFTCLSIREVHLEVVGDMPAETFLGALRRFVARRGKPKVVISDNALQFNVTRKVLETAEKVRLVQGVQNHLNREGIEWKFIPALAPWAGGVYERMVGITKSALKKAVGKSCLTFEQLQTILTEVEGIVNSRPISFVNMSSDDLDLEILTPQKFLSTGRSENLPILEDEDPSDPNYLPKPQSHTKLIQMWKQGQYFLNKFWNIWYENYLPSLRERHISDKFPKVKSQVFRAPRVGEIVLIKNANMPRGMWKLGKVMKLHEGKDGLIRSVEIKVPGNRDYLTRPVSLIFPLEIQPEEVESKNSAELSLLTLDFTLDKKTEESYEDPDTLQITIHPSDQDLSRFVESLSPEPKEKRKPETEHRQVLKPRGSSGEQPSKYNQRTWKYPWRDYKIQRKNSQPGKKVEATQETRKPVRPCGKCGKNVPMHVKFCFCEMRAHRMATRGQGTSRRGNRGRGTARGGNRSFTSAHRGRQSSNPVPFRSHREPPTNLIPSLLDMNTPQPSTSNNSNSGVMQMEIKKPDGTLINFKL